MGSSRSSPGRRTSATGLNCCLRLTSFSWCDRLAPVYIVRDAMAGRHAPDLRCGSEASAADHDRRSPSAAAPTYYIGIDLHKRTAAYLSTVDEVREDGILVTSSWCSPYVVEEWRIAIESRLNPFSGASCRRSLSY